LDASDTKLETLPCGQSPNRQLPNCPPHSPGNRDIQAKDIQLQLMGYDRLDGQHERPLLQARSNYNRSLLSPNGRQVIFTDRVRGRVMLCDWSSNRFRTKHNWTANGR
jgi:hypothetical protein